MYIIQCLFVQCLLVQCLLYSGVISLHFLQEPVSVGASELSSLQLLAVTISLYSREGGERGGEREGGEGEGERGRGRGGRGRVRGREGERERGGEGERGKLTRYSHTTVAYHFLTGGLYTDLRVGFKNL